MSGWWSTTARRSSSSAWPLTSSASIDRSSSVSRGTGCRSAPPSQAPVTFDGGFQLLAPRGLRRSREVGTVIVSPTERPKLVPPATLRALRLAHRRGARLVSLCTGAFVLAATRPRQGRRYGSTSWEESAELARRHPEVSVDPGVLYIDDGDILHLGRERREHRSLPPHRAHGPRRRRRHPPRPGAGRPAVPRRRAGAVHRRPGVHRRVSGSVGRHHGLDATAPGRAHDRGRARHTYRHESADLRPPVRRGNGGDSLPVAAPSTRSGSRSSSWRPPTFRSTSSPNGAASPRRRISASTSARTSAPVRRTTDAPSAGREGSRTGRRSPRQRRRRDASAGVADPAARTGPRFRRRTTGRGRA